MAEHARNKLAAFTDRNWQGDYRYGFNGKELDYQGLGGGQSTYDYGFRIYNAALGKFLSVDPLRFSFPWFSPYNFAGNTPIMAIDLEGLEELVIIRWYDGDQYIGQTCFRVPEGLRELGKRNGSDRQVIEMPVSQQKEIEIRLRNGKELFIGDLKNDDGSFYGNYSQFSPLDRTLNDRVKATEEDRNLAD